MTVHFTDTMTLPDDIEDKKATAQAWFRALRDRITTAFESIEDAVRGPNAHMPAGRFQISSWDRPAGGGGARLLTSRRPLPGCPLSPGAAKGAARGRRFRGETATRQHKQTERDD